MSSAIELLLASPPERDFLTCELLQDDEVFAEVRIEGAGFAVELRPRHGGASWDLNYDDLLKALTEAKGHLSAVDTSVII
ncbi:hypothetical protein [Brevundimonas sp. GCM10030266]|uniref:hypothetical protein n=1 Tax=Brevundimonas sp. GCM10030266 TaxID=3273386 RepID=UPI00360A8714